MRYYKEMAGQPCVTHVGKKCLHPSPANIKVVYLYAKEEIGLMHIVLVTIGQLVLTSPHVNGNGAVWKQLTDRAEAKRGVLCNCLDGKALFTVMLCLYTATHLCSRHHRGRSN
jgi:hypothetical protein